MFSWLLDYSAIFPILFLAAFIRSALGFGDAVVAMPLLALVIQMVTATPLVALFATTSAIVILLKNWQKADWAAASRLIVAAIFGTASGLYLLKELPESTMKIFLGIVIAGYGLYNLFQPVFKPIKGKPFLTYLFGFVSGVLGGAYNTNGPPIVIYGKLRGWPPEDFRATLQGYFLPAGFIITLGHGLSGLWTPLVFKLYAANFPLVMLGIWLGGRANSLLPPGKFDNYLNIALIIMGLLLILKS